MPSFPDSKVPGANMGLIWGRQDPGRPHVGPMNFAIWVGSDNGLPPVRHQAIIWTNAGLLLIWLCEQILVNQNTIIYIQVFN